LGGLLILGAISLLAPENYLFVPLLLWLAGCALWFVAMRRPWVIAWLGAIAGAYAGLHLAAPSRATERYLPTHVETADVAAGIDRLGLFQDDWASSLAWTTLATACIAALLLVLLPLALGWRALLGRNPGKVRSI